MSEHTPTPWTVMDSDGVMDSKAKFETGSKVLIYNEADCEYHPIADCSCNNSCRIPSEQEANAAFIVNAVNSHDALVEALTDLIEAVRRDSDEGGKGISGYTGARLYDARAVLAAVGNTGETKT